MEAGKEEFVKACRARYAKARAEAVAMGMAAAEFRYRAGSVAGELADGEEVEPGHWAMAAEEVAWEYARDLKRARRRV